MRRHAGEQAEQRREHVVGGERGDAVGDPRLDARWGQGRGLCGVVIVIADQDEDDVEIVVATAGTVADGANHFAQGLGAGVVEVAAVENVIQDFEAPSLGSHG